MNSRIMTGLTFALAITGSAAAQKPTVETTYGPLLKSAHASPELKKLTEWAIKNVDRTSPDAAPISMMLANHLWKTDPTLKGEKRDAAFYDAAVQLAGDAYTVALYSKNMSEKRAGVLIAAGVMDAIEHRVHYNLAIGSYKNGLDTVANNNLVETKAHILSHVYEQGPSQRWRCEFRDMTVKIDNLTGGTTGTTNSGLTAFARTMKYTDDIYAVIGDVVAKAVKPDASPVAYKVASDDVWAARMEKNNPLKPVTTTGAAAIPLKTAVPLRPKLSIRQPGG